MAGEPRWIHLRSPNFEVYSSAGSGSTLEALRNFEFIRGFFLQMLGPPPKQRPVCVIIFGSAKEYARYRPAAWSAAAYHESGGRDTIVMGDASGDSFHTAIHEYFHLWAHREKLDLPLWLNEGLAQLYSTLRPTLGGQVVGEMPAGFGAYLSQNAWMPLHALLAARNYPGADQGSEVYDFYFQSWALVHMLELSAEYRPGAAKILPALQAGLSSEEALTKIYGKSLAAIEIDLRAYVRDIDSRTEVYRSKLPKAPKPPPIEAATEFDRRLVLVRLLPPQSRAEEIRSELEALSVLDPKRPEPHAELGSLAASRGDAAAARREYGRAFDLGDLDPDALWEYARLLQDKPPEAIQVLERLLRVDPDREDARLELTRLKNAAK